MNTRPVFIYSVLNGADLVLYLVRIRLLLGVLTPQNEYCA
jgi:hypothetical protein